jgi:predicted PurR-regulated permease PerM
MVQEEKLDVVLVPLALAALAGYHLWLLYTILRHPTRTIIGVNAMSRKRWVAAMMAVSIVCLTISSSHRYPLH